MDKMKGIARPWAPILRLARQEQQKRVMRDMT